MSSKTPYAEFHQSLPVLENQYEADIFLQDYLAAYLPEDQQRAVLPGLKFSTTTSASRAISASSARPSGLRKSTARLRLLRLTLR